MRIATVPFCVLLGLLLPLAATAATTDSFFDVLDESAHSSPPYPGAESVAAVSHELIPGSLTVHGALSLRLDGGVHDYDRDSVPDVAILSARMTDSGGGPGSQGIDSFFDIFTDIELATGEPATVDVRCGHTDAVGQDARFVARNPAFPVGDPARYFDVTGIDSFFDIVYDIEYADGGIESLHMYGTCEPGSTFPTPPVFAVVADSGAAPTGEYKARFIFTMTVQRQVNSPPLGSEPLVTVQCDAVYTPESPVAVESRTWGAIKREYE